jgi:hypothetical protein
LSLCNFLNGTIITYFLASDQPKENLCSISFDATFYILYFGYTIHYEFVIHATRSADAMGLCGPHSILIQNPLFLFATFDADVLVASFAFVNAFQFPKWSNLLQDVELSKTDFAGFCLITLID